jgi:DNA-binding transcriptional regulator YiaG
MNNKKISIKQIIDIAMEHFYDYKISIERISDILGATTQTIIKWEKGITKSSKRNQKYINNMYKDLKTDSYFWESESEMLERKYGYW